MELHERSPEPLYQIMMARYYSSSLGRFMAVDPLAASAIPENPQSWNRYAYVANNPINRVDPDGRKDKRSEQDKKVTEDKDVKAKTQEAWKESNAEAKPEDRQEVGFAVVEGGSCTDYETTELQTQGDPAKVDLDVPKPPGTVATVHTHPLGNAGFKDETGQQKQASVKPGDGDRKLANDTKAPAYVVSKDKMYRVDPSTGKVSTVLSGQEFRDYMGPKK